MMVLMIRVIVKSVKKTMKGNLHIRNSKYNKLKLYLGGALF